MSYNYTVNRQIHDLYTLQLQIYKSGLTSISYITSTSTYVTMFFGTSLTLSQQTDLNTLVTNYVDSIEQSDYTELVSRINSTNVPLAADGVYDGVYEKISNYSTLTITCLTDADGILSLYSSNDGTTDHVIQTYNIKKNITFIEIKTIAFLYYKIKFTNDYIAQTSITLQTTANLYKVKNVVDTTQVNEISIKTEAIKTGGNFKTTSISLNIPGNTTSTVSYMKPYRLSILEFTFRTFAAHSNDIINAYIGKNTIVGVLASNAYTNNTSITVSSTVIENIYVGYDLSITNGTTTNFLGEVITITNNVLTLSGSVTNNFTIGAYITMSVKPVDNYIIGPAGLYNIGVSKMGASGIPANIPISLEYTNTSSDIKTFTIYLDYLY